MIKFLISSILISGSFISIPAQEPPRGIPTHQEEIEAKKEQARVDESFRSLQGVSAPKDKEIRSSVEIVNSRTKLRERLKELDKERELFLTEINEKLQIPAKYLDKYNTLTKEKKMNLARIFPDNGCYNNSRTVTVEELERCKDRPQIMGGGSLYSFRLSALPYYISPQLINLYFGESDIHFVGNKLLLGNKFTQDIIVEVGDVELENVTKKSDVVRFLNKWKLARKKSEFDQQKTLLAKGIENNGYTYTNEAVVKNNTTYLLRSIAYFDRILVSFWNTDQIVAFRIVGQEPDGSIIILWKKLKEKDAIKLNK